MGLFSFRNEIHLREFDREFVRGEHEEVTAVDATRRSNVAFTNPAQVLIELLPCSRVGTGAKPFCHRDIFHKGVPLTPDKREEIQCHVAVCTFMICDFSTCRTPEKARRKEPGAEFHTCVYDGPMFTNPVKLETGEEVNRDGFVYARLQMKRAIFRGGARRRRSRLWSTSWLPVPDQRGFMKTRIR